MDGRRTFIRTLLAGSGALLLAPSALASEFSEYLEAQRHGVLAMQRDWRDYRKNYQRAWKAYQVRLAQVWSEPQLSSKKVWVEHSSNLTTRRELDFERNEVRLSFTGDDAAALTEQRIRAEFERVMAEAVSEAWRQDAVMRAAEPDSTSASARPVSGAPVNWQQVKDEQSRSRRQTAKGEVVTITIPLANALPDRSREYLPLVRQFAGKWQTEPALVLAIMQTESAFNPVARSHIPAFGLMQIVPASAGRDASEQVYGRQRLMTGAELCTPEINIELGCAYLNLLDKRYLKAVKDPTSRLFCVIAAYNTGAGNVARAFSGNTSVADAARRINRMSPKQVYAHLRANLKYEEARNYLYKVTQALQTYRA